MFEEVEVTRNHEQVQGVAEVPVGEGRESVGGDDRVVTPRPGDDTADTVEFFGKQFGGVVGGHVLLVVGVDSRRPGSDLDVEIDERVQSALAVVRDGVENAPRNAVGAVGVGERQRRRLPEAVVLETGQRCGGRFGGRAVDDSRLDVAFGRSEAQVDVGGGNHRVAGGEEDALAVFGSIEYRLGVGFDAGTVPNLDVGVVVGFEVRNARSDEFAGVELREDAVGRPERIPSFDGNRAFVVETEANEGEHTSARVAAVKNAALGGGRSVRLTARRRRPPVMTVPCVRVPRERGEETRQRLAEADAIADGYEIEVGDGDIYIPVEESFDPAAVGGDVVYRDAPVREGQTLPKDLLGFDPSYERLGTIAIIDEDDDERARDIADALMGSELPIETVVNRASPIEGELRVRDWDVLAGETTETVHREYGCAFELDIAEVFFSPRLATERHRVTEQVESGEQFFDMFAGVGPFVIPAAKRGAECVGVDLNETAVEYLRRNAERNGVEDRVTAIDGDVRAVEGYDGWADRIVMNLPHSADEFLDTAVELAGDDCVIHYYDIQHDTDPFGPGEAAIRAAAEPAYEVTVETRHDVRSYAPHERNVCLDVRLRRSR